MEETKKIYESKAVIGAVVVVVSTLAGLFGYTNIDTASLEQIVIAVATLVGACIAIYGRVVADKKIS
jgi:hypothetical protein